MSTLSDNLKEARRQSGMKQSEVAEKLGVSQKDVSRWETGSVVPNAIMFGKFCEAIGVSADDVLRPRVDARKTKVVYEVEEHRGEIRDWHDVKPCCVMDHENWLDPQIIGKYATEEEAYEELKKHMPTCDRQSTHLGWIYIVTEYVFEKHVEDENGEFVEGSDYDYVYDYRWDDEKKKLIVEK